MTSVPQPGSTPTGGEDGVVDGGQVELLLHVLHGHSSGSDVSDQRAVALQSLQQALPPDQVLKLRTKFLVREGGSAREIVNVARELAVDLIVMGTRGRRGWHIWRWEAWPRQCCEPPAAP